MRLFYDTGAFCALAILEDEHHKSAQTCLELALYSNPIQFTSNYVLDETYTLIRSRRGHFTAVTFMKNYERLAITVLRVTEEIEMDACTIFRKYDLPRLSFTDCTSFALVNAHNIDHVFSFDEHFRMFRYNHPVTLLGAAQ
jgi:predicted nucleic acid-binding protein